MNLEELLKTKGLKVIHNTEHALKTGDTPDINAIEVFIDELISKIVSDDFKTGVPHLNADSLSNYIAVHSLNVTLYSLILSARMGYKGHDLVEIGIGALLHDMGKINTPEHLIHKQSGESDYEKATIAEHTVFGAHWLASAGIITEVIKKIISDHHENFDGSGYPVGISDVVLSDEARIVGICNFYDYLVRDLPGKKGLSVRDALVRIYLFSKKRFNPKFVDTFLKNLGPILLGTDLMKGGSLVLLNTKEIAQVKSVKGFTDFDPDIVILTDREGAKLERPLNVNLRKDISRRILKIIRY